MWNMKITGILILNSALRTLHKELIKEQEVLENRGQVEIRFRHYEDRPEYWKESFRLEGTYCQSNSLEKPSANVVVENLKKKLIYYN